MLKVVEVTEADAGDYQCTASNKLGSAQHMIKVTVKGTKISHTTYSLTNFFFSIFVNIWCPKWGDTGGLDGDKLKFKYLNSLYFSQRMKLHL